MDFDSAGYIQSLDTEELLEDIAHPDNADEWVDECIDVLRERGFFLDEKNLPLIQDPKFEIGHEWRFANETK